MKQETRIKKAARAVAYEIWMFRESAKTLFLPRKNVILKNILLESFAVHAYNLYRFFYQGRVEKRNKRKILRKESDIIAEDFGIKKQQFRTNRTPKKYLKPIVVKRDKQVAHLTYNRVYRNRATKPWQIGKISAMMEQTITAFFDSLPEETKFLFK